MSNLAQSLKAQGDLVGALELEEEILEVSRRRLGAEHPETLISMGNLAQSLKAQGDLVGALKLEEEILEVSRRRLGAEHPITLISMNNLAESLKAQGDVVGALELFEQVLEVRRKRLGAEHPDILISMSNLAQSLKAQGDLVGALELQQQVLEVSRRRLGAEHPDTLRSMSNLASTLHAQGDLIGALELEEEILEVRQRRLGAEHPDTLRSMSNLASTLYAQGDRVGALELEQQVLEVSRKRLGAEHPDTLRSMNNLAQSLKARGDLVGALELEEQVVEILRRRLGAEHPDILISMSNLAQSLKAQGDLVGALELQQQVLEVSRRRLGAEHPDTLRSMNNLAGTLRSLGQFASARELYEEALAIRESLTPPGHQPDTHEYTLALGNLASLYRNAKNFRQARGFYLRALDAIEALTQNADYSEDVKGRFRVQYGGTYRAAIKNSIALGLGEEAFDIVERYRAQSLLTLVSDDDLSPDAEIPPELSERLREVSARYDATLRQLDLLASAVQPDKEKIAEIAREHERWRRERDVLEGKILQAARGPDWKPPKPRSLREIRQALDPGTLLISYTLAEEGLDVFLISNQSDLEIHHLDIDHQKLFLQVQNFSEDVREAVSSKAIQGKARWLYQKLLEPIAEHIAASDRLLILPDGPLHLLPFAALNRPTGKGTWEYLVEWKPLHVAASGTVYAELRGKTPKPAPDGGKSWDLVAFGDPVYPVPKTPDPESTESSPAPSEDSHLPAAVRSVIRRGIFDGGLEPLPHTRRELEEIGRLFSKETALIQLQEEALEKHAKSRSPRGRIVHFATHGFADSENPSESFLALTIPEAEGEHNGLLQAWEIRQNLPLQADLVVLSACRTAIGDDYGGEGLMSLSRTFQIAGSRTVVASQWSVNDASTAELMIRFYRYLKDGKSKDEALQAAQIDLIRGPIETVDEDGKPVTRDFSAPYYWAAFQVHGDRL